MQPCGKSRANSFPGLRWRSLAGTAAANLVSHVALHGVAFGLRRRDGVMRWVVSNGGGRCAPGQNDLKVIYEVVGWEYGLARGTAAQESEPPL